MGFPNYEENVVGSTMQRAEQRQKEIRQSKAKQTVQILQEIVVK